jgi:ABC-type molybdate transport system ATPase subunit
LEEPQIPTSITPDVREIKIAVFGKSGVGKTSAISNICGICKFVFPGGTNYIN